MRYTLVKWSLYPYIKLLRLFGVQLEIGVWSVKAIQEMNRVLEEASRDHRVVYTKPSKTPGLRRIK
jgi:hypothetical protein